MAGPGAKLPLVTQPKLRLDKWLFQARFFRSRVAAADMVLDGGCRINRQPCAKPAHGVAVGDVLTFVQLRQIRVIRVQHLSQRRGPAFEAVALYDDLHPPSALESPGPLD